MFIKKYIAAVLVLILIPASPTFAEDGVDGRYVQVKPLIGYAIRPIRKFVTFAEFEVIRKVDQRVRAMDDLDERGDAIVAWHVESDVEYSPTYRLQQQILRSLRRMLVGVHGFTSGYKMDIVVGRTQGFIMSILDRLGCDPELSAFDGQILMGAALCNRRVLVTNLTGYLFLRNPDQRITVQMERRKEPPLFETPYQIVARNSSSLAHEWMHFYRMAGLGGELHLMSLSGSTKASPSFGLTWLRSENSEIMIRCFDFTWFDFETSLIGLVNALDHFPDTEWIEVPLVNITSVPWQSNS